MIREEEVVRAEDVEIGGEFTCAASGYVGGLGFRGVGEEEQGPPRCSGSNRRVRGLHGLRRRLRWGLEMQR